MARLEIDRYLARLLVQRGAVALTIVFAALMLERALRLTSQMAAVGAHLAYLPGMIAALAPYYFGLALPAALLIALLLTVARLDEDRELDAMLAAGVPAWRIAAPLAAVGAAVGALNILVAGFLEPHGHYAFRALKDQSIAAGWTAQLRAGALQTRGADLAITADAADATGRKLSRIFVHLRDGEGPLSAITAPGARLDPGADGGARLTLAAGQARMGEPGGPTMAGAFDRFDLDVPAGPEAVTAPRGADRRELTLAELAVGPSTLPREARAADLHGRLARALACPLLPLLALPLAMAGGRSGRRWPGIAMAALILIGFQMALRLAQSLAAAGHLPPALTIWGLFAAFAALAGAVFAASGRIRDESPLAGLLARLPALPRLPTLRQAPTLPGGTLAGYVTATFAGSLLGASLSFTALIGAFDLFERTDDILDRGLGIAGLVRYAALRAPINAEQTAGLAVLVGAVLAFLRLSRSSEITAMRQAGVSLPQILAMALPTALGAMLAIGVVADQVAPRAQLQLAAMRQATEAQGPSVRWFRIGPEIVRVGAVSPDARRMELVAIYRRGADGALTEELQAQAASAQGGAWRLEDARLIKLTADQPEIEPLTEAAWRTPLAPADLSALIAAPLQISSRAALRALEGQAPTTQARSLFVTRLHRAFAEPAAALVMLLLALPLVLSQPRTGPSGKMLLYVLGGGLAYATLDGFATALGQTGLAPPALAAWITPLLGAALAAAVAARQKA